MTYTIKYKQEDNINFKGGDAFPNDEVVRYGKDYNYQGAQKVLGKQPVYTADLHRQLDRRQERGRPDIDDRLQTPAAFFGKGTIHMHEELYATTEESIEVTSGVARRPSRPRRMAPTHSTRR